MGLLAILGIIILLDIIVAFIDLKNGHYILGTMLFIGAVWMVINIINLIAG